MLPVPRKCRPMRPALPISTDTANDRQTCHTPECHTSLCEKKKLRASIASARASRLHACTLALTAPGCSDTAGPALPPFEARAYVSRGALAGETERSNIQVV